MTLLLTGTLIFSMITGFQDKKPWPVPDKYVKMENPVKPDEESINKGKSLYIKNCQSCHGKTGKGDGPKSAQLDTPPENFLKGDILNQTDGELFYKISEGRKDMPASKKKITDPNDIWSITNYIKTFKK